jgi:hypothetical protein
MSIRRPFKSACCAIADPGHHEWVGSLIEMTKLVMGYTHEGVSAVESLEQDAMYAPDVEELRKRAALSAVFFGKNLADDDSDGRVLYFAKRQLIKMLRIATFTRAADIVESTQSKGTLDERVPRSA